MRRVLDPVGRIIGMAVVLAKGNTLFIADTSITEVPEAHDLAEIARIQRGARGEKTGLHPARGPDVLLHLRQPAARRARPARARSGERNGPPCTDVRTFEYEGEMPPDVALDPDVWANYPFQRLSGPANVLIMPAIHSASISTRLVQAVGGATVIGPLLLGLERSVQICAAGLFPRSHARGS